MACIANEGLIKVIVGEYIEEMLDQQSDQASNAVLDKLLDNVMFDIGLLKKQYAEFCTLGQLQNPGAESLHAFTANGKFIDLFKLNKNEKYILIHNINISKIARPVDFSNLVVCGSLVCKRAAAPIILPSEIVGELDLSEYKFIDTIHKIPNGATSVNLAHSVKSFAKLNQLEFPESCTEVLLARSVLGNITNDAAEKEQFDQFTSKYPDIQIWDYKHNVSVNDVLNKKQKSSEPKRPVQKTEPVIKFKTFYKKTHDWLTRREIASLCKSDARFDGVANIDRLVERATPNACDITEFRMHNGEPVVCVAKANLQKVTDKMIDIMDADNKRAQAKLAVQVNEVKIIEPEIIKNAPQKIEPVVIEKYFVKSVWKNIRTYCGDSKQKLLTVLNTINQLNQVYIYQKAQETVLYLNGSNVLQPLTGLTYKTNRAATQAIGSDGNTRIVWTQNPDDMIMVAIAFYANHDKSDTWQLYNNIAIPAAARGKLIDGVTSVNQELVTQENFLNVRDLLAQYTNEPIISPINIAGGKTR